MVHADHVALIAPGLVKNSGGVWADFGSGKGAFTLALRDVLGPDIEIYSIDRDKTSLKEQETKFDKMFPHSNIHYISTDFTQELSIPSLDGWIAANSIHFQKDHVAIFKKLKKYLKPKGKIIIVEYNVDRGNVWVPYPFSFQTLQKIASRTGLSEPKLLHTVPSHFLEEIYSAAMKKGDSFHIKHEKLL